MTIVNQLAVTTPVLRCPDSHLDVEVQLSIYWLLLCDPQVTMIECFEKQSICKHIGNGVIMKISN